LNESTVGRQKTAVEIVEPGKKPAVEEHRRKTSYSGQTESEEKGRRFAMATGGLAILYLAYYYIWPVIRAFAK
jgi:hypothetical protein